MEGDRYGVNLLLSTARESMTFRVFQQPDGVRVDRGQAAAGDLLGAGRCVRHHARRQGGLRPAAQEQAGRILLQAPALQGCRRWVSGCPMFCIIIRIESSSY